MAVKHKTPVDNRIIPLIVLGVQIVVRFGLGVEAGSGDGALQAGFWGDLGAIGSIGLWQIGQATVDTGLALLTHSVAKLSSQLTGLGFRKPPEPPIVRW
jgi:hypothetical protein